LSIRNGTEVHFKISEEFPRTDNPIHNDKKERKKNYKNKFEILLKHILNYSSDNIFLNLKKKLKRK